MSRLRIITLAGLLAWTVAPATVWAQAAVQPLQRPALVAPHALRAATLAIAEAGTRLVVVGERGVILLSDDKGGTWRQVPVPVSVTLTAVAFVDEKRGWVTGHSGVVLATSDAGETWQRVLDGEAAAKLALSAAEALVAQVGTDDLGAKSALAAAKRLVADGADKPLLDIYFADANRGFAVGAYGLTLSTNDGGRTWASAADRIDNPKGLHLNAIAGRGETIVIVGEQGLVLRSTDGGQRFMRLETPYRGSWFAVHVGASNQLVLGGLRGNAYFSPDLGTNWAQISFGIPASITALAEGPDGRILAGNQAGLVYASRDGGQSFRPLPVQAPPPLAALKEVDSGVFVVTGLRGVNRLGIQGRTP